MAGRSAVYAPNGMVATSQPLAQVAFGPRQIARLLVELSVGVEQGHKLRQVVEAGRSLKISVHDHLVVGRDGVASFKALGLI